MSENGKVIFNGPKNPKFQISPEHALRKVEMCNFNFRIVWDKNIDVMLLSSALEIRSTSFIVYTKTRTLTQTMPPNGSNIPINSTNRH